MNDYQRSRLVSFEYFNILLSNSGRLSSSPLSGDFFENTFIKSLFNANDLSLRLVEKFVRNLELFDILASPEAAFSSKVSTLSKIFSIIAIFILTIKRFDDALVLLTSDTSKISALFESNAHKDRLEMIKMIIAETWDNALIQKLDQGWRRHVEFIHTYKDAKDYFKKLINLMQFL